MESNGTQARIIIGILFLIIVSALSAAALLLSRPEATFITIHPPRSTPTPAPTATLGPIQVYVTGAVLRAEQVHSLPHGSRVADAIDLAGGFSGDANIALVNLAGILRDGDQIHVPTRADADGGDETLPTPSGGPRLPINTATQAELETLPGIGPATARAIIEHREAIGGIKNWDDLDAVPRIGPSLLEALQDLIHFD